MKIYLTYTVFYLVYLLIFKPVIPRLYKWKLFQLYFSTFQLIVLDCVSVVRPLFFGVWYCKHFSTTNEFCYYFITSDPEERSSQEHVIPIPIYIKDETCDDSSYELNGIQLIEITEECSTEVEGLLIRYWFNAVSL